MNILNDINTTLCPIKVNSNTIEITGHTSCYCILDLLCVSVSLLQKLSKINWPGNKQCQNTKQTLHECPRVQFDSKLQ